MKTTIILCCILSTLSFISKLNCQILYSESASASGVNHLYGNGAPGCGISFYDFNQDGRDDLTLGGVAGRGISFYRNTGGHFQLMAVPVIVPYEVKQILWVDFDNDGDKDLYVACFDGHNLLFENKGNLSMVNITEESGLPTEIHRGFGALWADFNRDGWLDLYYVKRRTVEETILNENRLFLNHPGGIFTEVTDVAGVADRGRKPFCAVAVDYDNDKWPDIYSNNDKQTINTMLHNNGDGSFTDVSVETGTNIQMDAMGTALGDYNNDGWLDLYVSNIPDGNVLLHNNGPDDHGVFTFTDLATPSNTIFNGVAWGTNFLDADNDGDLDLYVNSMMAGEEQVNSTLYENLNDGTFRNLEGLLPEDTCVSFSNAIGDFNEDGIADIAVVNQADFRTQLWRSQVSLIPNHFLKIQLRGVVSNRDGIGTRIETYADGHYQMRYTHCGIGFLGQNSGTEIFGFATIPVIDSIRVTWPTGHVDMLKEVATDETILIIEGSTTNGEIKIDPDITIISATEEPDNNSTNTNITITPNPAKETIHLPGSIQGEFTIYDALGRMRKHGKLTGEDVINIESLPAGWYHIKINDGQKRYSGSWVKL